MYTNDWFFPQNEGRDLREATIEFRVDLLNALLQLYRDTKLSAEELVLIVLEPEGWSDPELAWILETSEHWVKYHKKRVYRILRESGLLRGYELFP